MHWWLGPESRSRSLSSGGALRRPVGSLVRDDGSLAFDERFLDHKMAGLAVVAFGKTARFEHLAQLFQHRRAATHHDAVGVDTERRLADILEQLRRSDQVGDAAAVAERLAGDGRIVHELFRQERPEQVVVPQFGYQLFAVSQL